MVENGYKQTINMDSNEKQAQKKDKDQPKKSREKLKDT